MRIALTWALPPTRETEMPVLEIAKAEGELATNEELTGIEATSRFRDLNLSSGV